MQQQTLPQEPATSPPASSSPVAETLSPHHLDPAAPQQPLSPPPRQVASVPDQAVSAAHSSPSLPSTLGSSCGGGTHAIQAASPSCLQLPGTLGSSCSGTQATQAASPASLHLPSTLGSSCGGTNATQVASSLASPQVPWSSPGNTLCSSVIAECSSPAASMLSISSPGSIASLGIATAVRSKPASPQLPSSLGASVGGVTPERPLIVPSSSASAGSISPLRGAAATAGIAVERTLVPQKLLFGTHVAQQRAVSSPLGEQVSSTGAADMMGPEEAVVKEDILTSLASAAAPEEDAETQMELDKGPCSVADPGSLVAWLPTASQHSIIATPLQQLQRSPPPFGEGVACTHASLFAVSPLDVPGFSGGVVPSDGGSGGSRLASWAALAQQLQADPAASPQLPEPFSFPLQERIGSAAPLGTPMRAPGVVLMPPAAMTFLEGLALRDPSPQQEGFFSARSHVSAGTPLQGSTPSSQHLDSAAAMRPAGTADISAASADQHSALAGQPDAAATNVEQGSEESKQAHSLEGGSLASSVRRLSFDGGDEAEGAEQAHQQQAAGGGSYSAAVGQLPRLGSAQLSVSSLQTVDEEAVSEEGSIRVFDPVLNRPDGGGRKRRGCRGRAHACKSTAMHASSGMLAEAAIGSPRAPARGNKPGGPLQLVDVIMPALKAKEAAAAQHAAQDEAEHEDEPDQELPAKEESPAAHMEVIEEQAQEAAATRKWYGPRSFADVARECTNVEAPSAASAEGDKDGATTADEQGADSHPEAQPVRLGQGKPLTMKTWASQEYCGTDLFCQINVAAHAEPCCNTSPEWCACTQASPVSTEKYAEAAHPAQSRLGFARDPVISLEQRLPNSLGPVSAPVKARACMHAEIQACECLHPEGHARASITLSLYEYVCMHACMQQIPVPKVQPILVTPSAGKGKGGALSPARAPTEAWAIKADWQPFQPAQQRQALQGQQQQQTYGQATADAAHLFGLQGELPGPLSCPFPNVTT